MNIEKIMTRRVVSVEMDDSLSLVKTLFEKVSFHHLLVVEQNKLVGIISDRDLLKALSPYINTAAETQRDLNSLNKKAHQIMSRNPITLRAQDSVYQAIDVFMAESISCIPITDEDKKPIGILSWRDILHALAEKKQAHEQKYQNNEK